MDARLTDELRDALAARPGEPIPLVDEATGGRFYVISEDRLAHLEAVAREQSEATTERLRQLIAEGDASPDVPADEARERILRMAREADARHA